MIRQPVRGIFLGPHETHECGHVLDRSLLDAGTGRRLKTEDKYQSGHLGPFAAAVANGNAAIESREHLNHRV